MTALRARSIRVDKQQRKVFVTVSFPDVATIDEKVKSEIIAVVKKSVPKGYYGMVSFADDKFTELTFRKYLADLLKKRFPIYSINKEKTMIKIGEHTIDVAFAVSEVEKKAMETSEFLTALSDIFADYTSYEITFELVADDSEAETTDLSMQEKLVKLAVNRELMRPVRVFRVENVLKCIGKLIDSSPMYISDIRKPTESCVICGKVSDKKLQTSKNNPNLWIMRFTLTDDSGGKIAVIMFARLDIADIDTLRETHADKTEEQLLKIAERKRAQNDKKLKKMMTIYDTLSVIVRGRIAFNDFSEELEMSAYDLCTCDILPINMQPTVVRSVPENYSLITPTVYEEFRQMSFTAEISGQNALSGKKFVVLHVNGTGFEMTKDKFFALNAVKVEDGRITEQFFSYLNPEVDIDPQALAHCDTSVDKLVYCPTITEIIPDLYKFVYGYDLVGTPQLSQIKKIINYYASPVGFVFDNNLDSQAEMIGTLYDRSRFDKKPNCANIAEVCKSLKLPCVSESFCLHSAEAVARSLCLLAENCD